MPRDMQDSAASSLPGSLRAQYGDGAVMVLADHCLSMRIGSRYVNDAGPCTTYMLPWAADLGAN